MKEQRLSPNISILIDALGVLPGSGNPSGLQDRAGRQREKKEKKKGPAGAAAAPAGSGGTHLGGNGYPGQGSGPTQGYSPSAAVQVRARAPSSAMMFNSGPWRLRPHQRLAKLAMPQIGPILWIC